MEQLSIFSLLSPLEKKAPERVSDSDYDPNEAAYVYIATMHGPGRVLYKTTVKDAMQICELPERDA